VHAQRAFINTTATENHMTDTTLNFPGAYEQAFHDSPVREFAQIFGGRISFDPNDTPPIATHVLRVQMIASELVELARAMGVALRIDTSRPGDEDSCVLVEGTATEQYNPIEAADAFGDIRYLTDGGNIECGFPGEIVLAEIHRSNLSKLMPDGSVKRREDGKVMKGPNYFKPNIGKCIGMIEVQA
jgi:predicted HAD superfamily Cof-like phosphohydrolase